MPILPSLAQVRGVLSKLIDQFPTVYHGSRNQFEKFSHALANSETEEIFVAPGIHFSGDPKLAAFYLTEREGGLQKVNPQFESLVQERFKRSDLIDQLRGAEGVLPQSRKDLLELIDKYGWRPEDVILESKPRKHSPLAQLKNSMLELRTPPKGAYLGGIYETQFSKPLRDFLAPQVDVDSIPGFKDQFPNLSSRSLTEAFTDSQLHPEPSAPSPSEIMRWLAQKGYPGTIQRESGKLPLLNPLKLDPAKLEYATWSDDIPVIQSVMFPKRWDK